jgi:2-methylcitrate dehydratase PrpD
LCARVQPFIDETIEPEWNRVVTPATLRVEFNDGQVVETRVNHPKGHPKNPMTWDEFAAKAQECFGFIACPLPAETPGRLMETFSRLETLPNLSELVGVMTS